MTNQVYGKAREKFLNGDLSWRDDNIKCVIVDTATYTVSIDSDEFLSAIPSGARTATSENLSSKTSTLGVADALDVTIASVAGNVSEALVIYKDTGDASTSPLIAYVDSATGIPCTPNGGDVVIGWDNGANKIFKL